ncbi:MAG: LicD family protein [Hyphomicrobiales bacterium]|nr:LicD family protein [Hyphomicrobiales bacterium]MCP5373359.1 LicD family protein [Hyphomicrobiales bacterium]
MRPPLRARLGRWPWLAAVFFWLFPKRLSGRGRRRGVRLLHDLTDALDGAGVPFQIDYGTLLGCLREGDFIPWDEDMDLAVREEDLPALRRAYDGARRRGLRVLEYVLPPSDYGDSGWRAGDLWMARFLRPPSLLFPRELFADVQVRRRNGDRDWWVILERGVIYLCAADAAWLGDGRRVDFLGRTVTLPAAAETYLCHLYGDWRQPVSDYTLDRDGAIVAHGRVEDGE